MDPNRFDHITRMFAERRLSRRQAVTASAGAVASVAALPLAGLASQASPGASPAASPSRRE